MVCPSKHFLSALLLGTKIRFWLQRTNYLHAAQQLAQVASGELHGKKKILFQQRATFLPAPLPSHAGLFCASVVNLHKDLLSAVQPEASKSTSIFGASPSASLLYLPQKDQDPRATIFLLHSHVNHRGRSGGGKL